MHYTVPFAVVLYVVSVIVDVVLGITTWHLYVSYMLRVAAVTGLIASYLKLVRRSGLLVTLAFILTSLALSSATMIFGNMDTLTLVNIGIKLAAIGLTVKPEIIEIEIITEDEEESQTQLPS